MWMDTESALMTKDVSVAHYDTHEAIREPGKVQSGARKARPGGGLPDANTTSDLSGGLW